jgi:murein DD-endopeptidase MepM/ murein hydrolase activator NlpD
MSKFVANLILASPWAMLIPFGMSMSSSVAALPEPSAQCEGVFSDGFDWPVGSPNAEGYYAVSRFGESSYLGEDWVRMGSEAHDVVSSISHGVVAHRAHDVPGLGNVLVIRHCVSGSDGALEVVDSLYGHLSAVRVQEGDRVERGQAVGLVGDDPSVVGHLHLEIRDAGLPVGTGYGAKNRHYDPSRYIGTQRPERVWAVL